MQGAGAVTLVLLVATLASPPGGPDADDEGPRDDRAHVDPGLRRGFEQNPVQVAVLVLSTWDEAVVGRVRELGLPLHWYEHLHMAAILLPASRLDEVSRVEGVEVVYRNERMHSMLARSAEYVGATIVWESYRMRGAGVTVLVVDTGVDGSHPDVRYGSNLVANAAPSRSRTGLVGGYVEGAVSTDAHGHGTHVAGIVGGTAEALGSGDALHGRYQGVAPEVSLIGFEAGVPDPGTGEATFDSVTVLEAYDYALEKMRAYNIRVVSNSWGSEGPFDPQSPINQATRTLYRAGLVVVFAAGNEGESGPGSLNPYSVAPWVLSVAAGNYLNQRASFSSIGTDPGDSGKPYDHPDVMAPGVQITSARARGDAGLLGTLAASTSDRDLYVTKSGTSMSCPHVAGAAALLLARNPALSPDEVYDLIVSTAVPLPGVPAWEGGNGYLNALAAYQESLLLAGSLDAFLVGNTKYAGDLVGDADYSEDPVSVGLYNDTAAGAKENPSLPEFGREILSSGRGLVFLVATVLLFLLAFRFERRAVP